jgi:hypothetical protein
VTPFANIRQYQISAFAPTYADIQSTGDNALRAVAASRPDMSKDIVSEPQRSVVRESGDAYCDLTGVKTDLTAAGEFSFTFFRRFSLIVFCSSGQVPGTRIRLFVSRGKLDTTFSPAACSALSIDIPDPATLMQVHSLAMQRFASTVILPLATIFRVRHPAHLALFPTHPSHSLTLPQYRSSTTRPVH